jgi:hypothetical protein
MYFNQAGRHSCEKFTNAEVTAKAAQLNHHVQYPTMQVVMHVRLMI